MVTKHTPKMPSEITAAHKVSIKTFMDTEFKQFSLYDNVRSIPSLIDGFKPSMRKCMYAVVKRGEHADEIKVAQLGAYCSQITDYHHGEGSLFMTIIGLAQDYPGSNNVNFLSPNGQFGSRLSPEAAAPRYIFTQLTEHFRKIFKKEDDLILKKQFSDDMEIEPEYFIPVIPTVLLNGSKGMGTGFATTILNYNPTDITKWILAYLNGKKTTELVPWYRGFKGKIYRNVTNVVNPKQVVIEGVLEVVNTTTIKITEIPIGTYLDDYKKHLNKLEDLGLVKSYDDNSTEKGFEFIVSVPRTTTMMSMEDLMIKFKLVARESENLTLWDENRRIREFTSVEEIVKYFADWRVLRYEDRRLALIDLHEADKKWLNEKLRFIMFYLKHSADFKNKKKAELMELLEANKFVEISRLMAMPIWSLTYDEIEKLKKDIELLQAKIDKLLHSDAKSMYIEELKELKFDI